jgi:uncharacterized damage-inducible protein DinB
VNQYAGDVARILIRELEGFTREVQMFPDDVGVWNTAPAVTNSAGNLALHVAGNLQYYIGTILGSTGYIRNRDAEFGRRSGSRAEIVAELDAAIRVVREVLPGMSEERLEAEFPEPIMGMKVRTGPFLLHLCVHAGFHLGQAGYLRRLVTASATSSGPIPLAPLAL